MAKVNLFKNGAWTSIERTPFAGHYVVRVYSPSGALLDRMTCDTYDMAQEYLKAFAAIAKAA